MASETKKMGRPPIEIDWKKFDELCKIQCTLSEFASVFDCSEDTIENKVKAAHGVTFSEYFKQKAGHGRASLRRRQFRKAIEEGNVAMLIWLGKQYLGQTDKQEIGTSDAKPIELKYSLDE